MIGHRLGFFCFLSLLSVSALAELTPAPATSGSKPTPLTLNEAIEDGVRGATDVLRAKNQIQISSADLLQAYGAYLPNLTAQAGYGYSSGRTISPGTLGIVDSKYRSGDYTVSSTLNIFNGFGDQAFFNSASNRKKAASLTLERVKELIALDVSQAYWQVALDHELTVISQQNLDVSQGRQKLFTAQKQVGQLNAADLYRQQAQTASDQASFINARSREYLDMLSLIRRLRLDARQTYELSPPPLTIANNPNFPNDHDLVETALRNRVDYKARGHERDAASSDVSRARKTYFPRLDLVAALDGEGRIYQRADVNGQSVITGPQRSLLGQLGDQTTGSLMLNLNWDIFDRLVTTSNVQKAKALEDDAQIDLEDSGNEVAVEVKQALTEYKTALDQLSAAEFGIQAAQKAFDLITGRYKIGASNFIDLSTAQAVLVQAQAAQAQSRIGVKLSGQALNTAMGRLPLGPLPQTSHN